MQNLFSLACNRYCLYAISVVVRERRKSVCKRKMGWIRIQVFDGRCSELTIPVL